MKCELCQIEYPDPLVRVCVSSLHGSEHLCGICALDRASSVAGVRLPRFEGPEAERMRQDAIAYRKTIAWKN